MYLLGLSGLVPIHKLLKRLARLNHKWNLNGRDPIVSEYLSKLHHDHLEGDADVGPAVETLNQTVSHEKESQCNSLSRADFDSSMHSPPKKRPRRKIPEITL